MAGSFHHNPEQLKAADRPSADYLAIGPVFSTSSKEKSDPVVGLEGVRRARSLTGKPGGDRRDYAGECGFRDRGWGRFCGGDIRVVTGAAQISRRVFPCLEVKSVDLWIGSPMTLGAKPGQCTARGGTAGSRALPASAHEQPGGRRRVPEYTDKAAGYGQRLGDPQSPGPELVQGLRPPAPPCW